MQLLRNAPSIKSHAKKQPRSTTNAHQPRSDLPPPTTRARKWLLLLLPAETRRSHTITSVVYPKITSWEYLHDRPVFSPQNTKQIGTVVLVVDPRTLTETISRATTSPCFCSRTIVSLADILDLEVVRVRETPVGRRKRLRRRRLRIHLADMTTRRPALRTKGMLVAL
jgi:hypothetical protein